MQDSLSRRIVRSLPPGVDDRSMLMTPDVPKTPRVYELYLRANQVSYERSGWTLAKQLYE